MLQKPLTLSLSPQSQQGGFAIGAVVFAILIAIATTVSLAATTVGPQVQRLADASAQSNKENRLMMAKMALLNEVSAFDNIPRAPAMAPVPNVTGLEWGGRIEREVRVDHPGSMAPYLNSALEDTVRYCAYRYDRDPDGMDAQYITAPQKFSFAETQREPLFAFIDSGPDGVFQTNCANARIDNAQGDDIVDRTLTALIPERIKADLLANEQQLASLPALECAEGEKLSYNPDYDPTSETATSAYECIEETDANVAEVFKTALPEFCSSNDMIRPIVDEDTGEIRFDCIEPEKVFDVAGEIFDETTVSHVGGVMEGLRDGSNFVKIRNDDGDLVARQVNITATCSAENPAAAVKVVILVDDEYYATVCNIENESGGLNVSVTNTVVVPLFDAISSLAVVTLSGAVDLAALIEFLDGGHAGHALPGSMIASAPQDESVVESLLAAYATQVGIGSRSGEFVGTLALDTTKAIGHLANSSFGSSSGGQTGGGQTGGGQTGGGQTGGGQTGGGQTGGGAAIVVNCTSSLTKGDYDPSLSLLDEINRRPLSPDECIGFSTTFIGSGGSGCTSTTCPHQTNQVEIRALSFE